MQMQVVPVGRGTLGTSVGIPSYAKSVGLRCTCNGPGWPGTLGTPVGIRFLRQVLKECLQCGHACCRPFLRQVGWPLVHMQWSRLAGNSGHACGHPFPTPSPKRVPPMWTEFAVFLGSPGRILRKHYEAIFPQKR